MPGDLAGKTIVITGATSGIGASAARTLAGRGATVVPTGRSPERAAALSAELGTEVPIADFARFSDVRALAAQVLDRCPRIDVLVHNAGGMVPERSDTEDGHETTLQTNYLAPFLLQSLVHERLAESRALVIVTSSVAHRAGQIRLDDLEYRKRRYSAGVAYGTAKLADLLFSRELARRAEQTGITSVAFHPGAVASDFGRGTTGAAGLVYNTALGRRLFTIDNDEGARPLVHLAADVVPQAVNGQYYNKLKPDASTSAQARDADLAQRLWEATEELLASSEKS
ncbi:NAD(P)-dependent dehydrogenase, short-chain alcohol dehydrogenase family [Cryptosporangium aurantiacum]|uniref:NAD(P)-dependent dehydrogenase, short-chain alcohol dehydrogenase family n=2 Tax=Cryptosporangium aurantiacum TaxID=134849 RepID=A0A1M7PAE1_9ACTN|nr:NAD(P)-dependent dehydrogenase, short-chain alcohol dehydrogenase family [Cryptosporangium aurantiacum]